MTTAREQFEAEYSELMGTPVSVLEKMRDGDEYRYTDGHRMQIAWLIWQASRAAIVVELDKCNCDNGEESVWDDAIEYCEATLRAAGITVKGDS
jgi:hypothetical protein